MPATSEPVVAPMTRWLRHAQLAFLGFFFIRFLFPPIAWWKCVVNGIGITLFDGDQQDGREQSGRGGAQRAAGGTPVGTTSTGITARKLVCFRPVGDSRRSIRSSRLTTFPMYDVLLAFSRQQHTELTDRLPDRKSKDDSCYFVSSIFHSRFSLHSETSSNSSSRSLPAGLSKASFVAAQVAKFG